MARHCCSCWRCTYRHRHVQRPHAFLCPRSRCHGQRWSAAESAERRMANGVPWVAVLVCGVAWALALGFNLTRLLELDILLYGLSLVLEFVALAVLRWREPSSRSTLPRSFRPRRRSHDWHRSLRRGFLHHLCRECRSHYSQVTGDSFRNFSRGCGSVILSVHASPKTRGGSYNFVTHWYTKMMSVPAESCRRKLSAVNPNPAFDMPFHQPWCSFEKK